VTIREVSKKLARVPKTVCYSSPNRLKRTFSRKNKIRTRLARRPTLVVLCLKLWSIRGGGTVRVMKCVILASVWASNCLLRKATKTTRKRPGTWTLWSKNKWKPHIMSSTRILWQSVRFPKSWPECRKPCAIAHENRTKRTFSRKNLNPSSPKTYPGVLSLKLWSVHGEGTVRVTQCVILASVWANNFLLGKVMKWP
jgi:hypothetical protein